MKSYILYLVFFQQVNTFISFAFLSECRYVTVASFETVIHRTILMYSFSLLLGAFLFSESSHGLLPLPRSNGRSSFEDSPSKMFQCPKCPRRYQWKSTMLRHIRTECGFAPQFQCPYCPQKTIRKDNLLTHINRKHCQQSPVNVQP